MTEPAVEVNVATVELALEPAAEPASESLS
jgi:hypothetical protein